MLALTMGDPAGIGGELTHMAWRRLHSSGPAFFTLADPDVLAAIDGAVPIRMVESVEEAARAFPEMLPVMPVRLAAAAIAGRPNPANGAATIASIEQAVRLVQAGEATAVVTNPIAKSVLYAAGFCHPGHTEFLAALTGAPSPVMMLVNRYLRVVPVTIHVSLRDALAQLTTERIVQTARITADGLRRHFGLRQPRLGVAGLNPHAGEDGAMGLEEAEIIRPAMARLEAEGIALSGPYPPDTMFTEQARRQYDVAICMYHDQALIPLKTLDLASGVNVTLGLPILRTSPDHGTAFDIAGTGRADPSSLIAALELAATMGATR